MDFSFREDLFLAILNLFWNILTWGYVDWALFVFSLVLLLVVGASLFFERGVILYIVKEKYIFLKEYVYIWLRQHISFLTGYFYVLRHQGSEVSWKMWLILFIALCVIIGSIIGVYFYFSPVEEVLV